MAEQWTSERDSRLTTLWLSGLSGAKIAGMMGDGFTRNSVIGRVHRMKLPKREPRKVAGERKRRKKKILQQPTVEIERRPTVIPPVNYVCVSIDELKPHHCRFPLGDFPVMYCGQQKIEGSSYCAYCHSVCYRQPV